MTKTMSKAIQTTVHLGMQFKQRKINTEEVHKFIDALYGNKSNDLYVLIWQLPSKKSTWIKDPKSFDNFMFDPENDYYVGCGLSPTDFGATRRCPKNRIAAIPGLWADIDFDAPKRLTRALADELIVKLPTPTVQIHSGHGYQCWWMFKELWIFENDEERNEAQSLSHQFNINIQNIARKLGGEIDSVHDLTRIMRIPGTWNNKSEPVEVQIVAENDNYYNPDDLREIVVGVKIPVTSNQTCNEIKLTLNTDAEPPFDKLNALLVNVQKFKQTWERKREDMKDTSASAYDMSLACFAVEASWSDQEITDLLIAHRRKHEDDLKLREDYYNKTISKAKSFTERTDSSNQLDEDNKKPKFTDLAIAKRVVMEHGHDLRYSSEWGTWIVYDGKRWIKDQTYEVRRRAKDTIRQIQNEAL